MERLLLLAGAGERRGCADTPMTMRKDQNLRGFGHLRFALLRRRLRSEGAFSEAEENRFVRLAMAEMSRLPSDAWKDMLVLARAWPRLGHASRQRLLNHQYALMSERGEGLCLPTDDASSAPARARVHDEPKLREAARYFVLNPAASLETIAAGIGMTGRKSRIHAWLQRPEFHALCRDQIFLNRLALRSLAYRLYEAASALPKLLPFGAIDVDLSGLAGETHAAINAARNVQQVKWTDGAASMWEAVYAELSKDTPGMLGAITARAEAQTVRLAMLYALLDQSRNIRRRHLRPALALWNFCDASARFIFGDLLGDPIADAILRALRQSPAGLSRTSIRDLFDRNASADKIQMALLKLLNLGKARKETPAPQKPGRPVEMWFAV